MKRIQQFLVALGVLALVPGFATQAQTSTSSQKDDRTVWIAPLTGTLLGGGYVSSYLTNIRAKTIKAEAPALRHAIDSLDALGMNSVKGFGLVPAAVSWQTERPMATLIEQQAETGLSYGELLLANSLATESKQSFARIIAMREQTGTWGELMKQLRINPDSIVTRANTASKRILDAEARRNRQRQYDKHYTLPSTVGTH